MSKIKPTIRLAVGRDRQAWDEYVLSHPEGLAYQLYAWKDAVENAYGFECPYFIAREDQIVCGVFPLARIHLPFCKGALVSLPYCDAGGILADSKEIEELLLKHALSFASEKGIRNLEVRSLKPLGNIPEEETRHREKVRMLLSLPEDAESLLSGFKAKLRSQVRKPKKDGLNAVIGGVELLEDFYPVFVENMRDLGSPVHSRKWLEQVLQAYGARAKCCVVYMPDGEPAAGGVILCHPKTVSIPWASSLRRLNRWNPNMLLYWAFLEYAADGEFSFFDFGRSTAGEGTYRFKEQWGARPQALHWTGFDALQAAKGEEIPIPEKESDSLSKGRESAEHVIQRMPLGMSQWLGSRVRKYISL
ncbi:MAG: GNAT family N-acetyltransferase [Candidatus Aminicenantes bacterium]|nr:GNAT family N-acetyltransferase [Candidatus Aminicenantes bacterium]